MESNGVSDSTNRLSAGASASFDPFDWNTLYFGKISRIQSDEFLENTDVGTFVIRESSQHGAYALDVKDIDETKHYLIVSVDGGTRWQIGEQVFPNIGALLNYYKMHYLEATNLIQPAPRRRLPKMIALFDFPGQAENDLAFKKGDGLWILNKSDDDQWWTAKDELGRSGQIPANYVATPDEVEKRVHSGSSTGGSSSDGQQNRISGSPPLSSEETSPRTNTPRKLPALARVIQERVPSAYDKSALRLRVGDIIEVTKINASGTWEGRLNNKSGAFPMKYIEWLDDVNHPR